MRILIVLLGGLAVACAHPTGSVRLIPVPGAKIYVETLGHGDPIVVVHGGPGLDHSYLLPAMGALASSHTLVFYDQRGVGRTEGDVDSTTVSFERFIADIDAVIDSLHLGAVTLLGHSWGGLLAMRYAARHPERLRALVLMNTVEPGRRYAGETALLLRQRQTPGDSAELAQLFRSPGLQRGDSVAVNAMFRTFFRASFADRSRAGELELHVSQRTATNMASIAAFVMGPLGPSFDLWPEAATIRVPTLIVHGVDDLVPAQMPRDLSRAIPHARLVLIEHAGHFPYIERPRETFAAINDVLR